MSRQRSAPEGFEPPVDLSALDPSLDLGWEVKIARVVGRVMARPRLTVASLLVSWARPAFALAAALALVAWAGAALAPAEEAEESVTQAVTRWAVDGETPTTHEVFQMMEAHHGS